MPYVDGGYVNPFYQEVDDFVRAELNERGRIYGARVRSTRQQAQNYPNDLAWAYKKYAFAQVIPEKGPTLGTDFSKIMSDRKGQLTLYDSTRNQPRFPLLQSVELSNEGTIGSLLKGKFTFIAYPDLNSQGFNLGELEEAFFKPGGSVTIRWGWSVKAANGLANYGELTGIIYNFNWSVNPDLSISADCSVVSKATIAMGISGEQTNPNTDTDTSDPLGKPIPDGDIAGIIEADLASIGAGKNKSLSEGQVAFYGRDKTKSGKKLNPYGLQYFAVGVPLSDRDSEAVHDKDSKKGPTPIVTPVYYVKLGDLMELINGLIRKAEEGGAPGASKLFRIVCNGNETEYLPDIVSCKPEEIFFPDSEMGKYGNFVPFSRSSLMRKDVTGTADLENNTVNIGNILVSTTAIIESYREFVEENQTSIEYKNITSFIDSIISKVNYASGETYQLTPRLIEQDQLTGATLDPDAGKKEALLSIEDTNLSTKAVKQSKAYKIDSSIAKPLIKNISISSKPPGPAAAAAYAEARANKSGEGLGPQQSDVRTATDKQINQEKYDDEFIKARINVLTIKQNFVSTGASNKFTTDLKGAYAKYKRSARGNVSSAHWLNRAIYPIDLTVTLDGIQGFKFGDVLKTNLIPATYNMEDIDMVFVVTKVTHTIQEGVWETTLNTKSRINMGHNPPVDTTR